MAACMTSRLSTAPLKLHDFTTIDCSSETPVKMTLLVTQIWMKIPLDHTLIQQDSLLDCVRHAAVHDFFGLLYFQGERT